MTRDFVSGWICAGHINGRRGTQFDQYEILAQIIAECAETVKNKTCTILSQAFAAT